MSNPAEDDGAPFLDDIFSHRVDLPSHLGGGHMDMLAEKPKDGGTHVTPDRDVADAYSNYIPTKKKE